LLLCLFASFFFSRLSLRLISTFLDKFLWLRSYFFLFERRDMRFDISLYILVSFFYMLSLSIAPFFLFFFSPDTRLKRSRSFRFGDMALQLSPFSLLSKTFLSFKSLISSASLLFHKKMPLFITCPEFPLQPSTKSGFEQPLSSSSLRSLPAILSPAPEKYPFLLGLQVPFLSSLFPSFFFSRN